MSQNHPVVPSVTAVVVAYGAEPELGACLEALLASVGARIDVVVVDNGDTSGAVDAADGRAGVTVVRPGENTGFAGGCNLGVRAAAGEFVALVNPDVEVAPDALALLADVAAREDVGIATASVRLGSDTALLNSAGNPVHYLGLAWAGSHGEPAAEHLVAVDVASASGACCVLRRTLWDSLGGFDDAYFAYHEDVELSLRCWQRGLAVRYVPHAAAVHHYEFARNRFKNELLERNRWLTVLGIYSTRTLVLLAPALLAIEVLLLGTAAAQGWLGAKIAGYRWLFAHRTLIAQRHRRLQAQRTRPDRELAAVLAARFEPTNIDPVPGLGVLNAALAGYWALVRRVL